ncbi:pilus assembly protein CpaE [Paraburkholderia sp. GAS199]|uniref:AAA family ATPase n=1 Tax=Paraburkholderia sp. GAS199 TaxID=3035126 RepID=UPI003D19E4A0
MSLMSLIKPGAAQASKSCEFLAFVADRDSEGAVRRYVLDQMMPHAHVAVGDIDAAIEFLKGAERSPSRLLVDISGSTMPVSDLARLAQVCEPSVKVFVLGDRNDVGLFRNLLQLGVSDYVVKPIALELLQRTLDGDTHSPINSARAGKVVSFIGTRGGVGVTTLALSISQHLAADTHRRVAYIDVNLRGGAVHSMLALDSNNGLADALTNVHRLDPQYLERTLLPKGNRFFVLSSELEYGADFTPPPGGLSALINVLKNSFHYVVLDVPNAQSPLAEEAISASRRVFVVADRSVHSARHAPRLFRYVESRSGTPSASLVLNNPTPSIPTQVKPADFMQAVGRVVQAEVPYDGRSVQTAENLGEAGRFTSASAFGAAVEQLSADLTGQPIVAQPGWIARRLKRRSA